MGGDQMIPDRERRTIDSHYSIEQYKMSADCADEKEIKSCGCIIITREELSEHDRPFTLGIIYKIVDEYQCKEHYKK